MIVPVKCDRLRKESANVVRMMYQRMKKEYGKSGDLEALAELRTLAPVDLANKFARFMYDNPMPGRTLQEMRGLLDAVQIHSLVATLEGAPFVIADNNLVLKILRNKRTEVEPFKEIPETCAIVLELSKRVKYPTVGKNKEAQYWDVMVFHKGTGIFANADGSVEERREGITVVLFDSKDWGHFTLHFSDKMGQKVTPLGIYDSEGKLNPESSLTSAVFLQVLTFVEFMRGPTAEYQAYKRANPPANLSYCSRTYFREFAVVTEKKDELAIQA